MKAERQIRDETGGRYQLQLYVTGNTARSARAISNMRTICDEHLPGRYDLKVIDIYQNPQASVDQQIIAAPTLVKLLPAPIRRVIGDMSDAAKVLTTLGLPSAGAYSGGG